MSPPHHLAAALADRYRIERELGQGGMATVYLAADLKHDRKVAIKVLKPDLAAVLGAERFITEIKTTAALSHPHILPLFDSGVLPDEHGRPTGCPYYVMPYIEGETIREKLNRETQFGIDEAVRITTEVADALDYAHRHGVIHRDIKPENILLHDGRAMVMDFGIALAVSAAAGGRMTETGLSLGTPHYMSPEQATADKAITARSDVYSLASVLFEMLTGEPPHMGNSAQAIIMKIVTDVPRSVLELRKSVPPNVAAAVAEALEKVPADRFASAKDFADALRNTTFTGHTVASISAPAARRPGPNRAAMALGATTVIATALAVAGWLRPGDPHEVSRYSVRFPEGHGLGQSQGSRIALSPDGTELVYESAVAGQSRLLLRRRDALVANPIPGTDGAVNPAFAPDGKSVAFTQISPRAVRVMSLANGLISTVADSLVDLGGVSWGYDGYIYYDGHLDGDGIARVREIGGRPEPVTRADSASGEVWHFRPHALPNGRNILFTISRGVVGGFSWFLGATEVGSGRHVTLIEGQNPVYADGFLFYTTGAGLLKAVKFDQDRLTMEGDPVPVEQGVAGGTLGRTDVAFSGTGTLAYASGASGSDLGELAWVSREGAITRIDTTWRAAMNQIALSPDGRRVAFQLAEGPDRSDIWVKNPGRGPAARLSFGGAPINRAPSWSPDSRDIVFVAAGSDTSAGVMRGPADGSGLPHRVRPFPGGGSTARLSPDGAWLLIEDGGGNILAARTTGDTALIDLLGEAPPNVAPQLSPDGRWLAYLSDESGQRRLYVRPFPDTRSAKRVISTESAIAAWWSPDGQELAYLTSGYDLIVAPVLPGAAFAVGERQVLFNVSSIGGLSLIDLVYSHDSRRFLAVVRVGQGDAPNELIMVENFLSEVRARVNR